MSGFTINLGYTHVAVDDIWPDGGAPENPTAEDVANVMRAEGFWKVKGDWDLFTASDVWVDGVQVWP